MPALIQASNLHRYYATTHAVKDVSIELYQGDILGLLGPNGAGKSSCLQMLCGVLAPSAGKILINGYDLLDQPNLAKQNIGYLPDTPPLYTELTVSEYIKYAATLRRIQKSLLTAYTHRAIELCGLAGYEKRLIGNLSKGYQQRVGIAQAIVHQPNIIVLDEPTVGLDPIQILEIRNLITSLGEHHGVILSTHILPEVQAVCNRVQMIHQGQSIINTPMSELKKSNQVRLQLYENISMHDLLKLPNVKNIKTLTDNNFILYGDNLHQSLSDISQYCVAQKWGLLEISLQENNLEEIFLNLTTGEDSHNEAAA